MPKIILVGNTSWSMYNFRKELIEFLIGKGFHIHLVAPQDKHYKDLIDLGVKFHALKLDKNKKSPVELLTISAELYRIYKRINPDLVIHYTIKPNIYGSMAARLLGVKHWSFVTGLGIPLGNNNFGSYLLKKLYSFSHQEAEKVFFLNREDKLFFLSNNLLYQNQVVSLPGEGINLNIFTRTTAFPPKISFLFIGRLIVEKGIEVYMKAAERLHSIFPEINFKILGILNENNPNSINSDTLRTLKNAEYLNYEGSSEDVRPFLEKASCLVFPSYYGEGLPRVLLEASAMQVPIITTDNVGCRDVVVDKLTGYMIQPQSIDSLVEAIEKFISLSYEERKEMGIRGREYVSKHFSMEKVIDIYKEELNKSLEL